MKRLSRRIGGGMVTDPGRKRHRMGCTPPVQQPAGAPDPAVDHPDPDPARDPASVPVPAAAPVARQAQVEAEPDSNADDEARDEDNAEIQIQEPEDRTPAHLARILEVVPDADIDWVIGQIHNFLPDPVLGAAGPLGPNGVLNGAHGADGGAYAFVGTEQSTDPVERVLALALENGYPKAKMHGRAGGLGEGSGRKRKRGRKADVGEGEMYRSETYRKHRRRGLQYVLRSKEWLEGFFDMVPLPL